MTDGKDGGGARDGRAKDGRAERLKAALRENLRRRKAQGRGRAEAQPSPDADQIVDGGVARSGPDSDKSRL
ncbi:hypothetical protein MKK69_13280 [Methylobacterium sp. J-026]|uniref:hypothetical protein n=1 Tax=Methylobacterium sp. J-026 TaxID=2836624 RepID=UPI001FB8F483|nr:hypothetical protein [Methylobacterium sp. J-026]MCJ2135019.1 hypothetical protein [Methylobacterium sp. J-026]